MRSGGSPERRTIATAARDRKRHSFTADVGAADSWDQEGQYIKATQPFHKKLNAKLAERKVVFAFIIPSATLLFAAGPIALFASWACCNNSGDMNADITEESVTINIIHINN